MYNLDDILLNFFDNKPIIANLSIFPTKSQYLENFDYIYYYVQNKLLLWCLKVSLEFEFTVHNILSHSFASLSQIVYKSIVINIGFFQILGGAYSSRRNNEIIISTHHGASTPTCHGNHLFLFLFG